MNMGSEIIYRDEADEIKKMKGWILIYGRRKVGKTFLIRNFLDYDVFFRVNRDGSILAEKFVMSRISNMDEFSKIVVDLLDRGSTVVIDEFQRLPESVLENISIVHPRGNLLLSGSGMRVIKNMLGKRSPLLGLTMQYRLGLIKPANIIRELAKNMDIVQAVELSPYLADAWTIPFLKGEADTRKAIYELMKYSKLTVPALTGEIFTEEEREFTRMYEAIMRTMGAGEWNYKNIASLLAGRKIIDRADSSLIIPYIKNMEKMGLIESLPVYSSKKKMYKLASPIMEAFYYLDDRYDFEEVEVSFEEAMPAIEKLRNLAIQNLIAELFASIHMGKKEYYMTSISEIDFIITVRSKPVLVGEVKWGRYSNNDIKNFLERSSFIKAEKVFVTKKKKEGSFDNVRIIDANDILSMAMNSGETKMPAYDQ
jgi:hypothetical protein